MKRKENPIHYVNAACQKMRAEMFRQFPVGREFSNLDVLHGGIVDNPRNISRFLANMKTALVMQESPIRLQRMPRGWKFVHRTSTAV